MHRVSSTAMTFIIRCQLRIISLGIMMVRTAAKLLVREGKERKKAALRALAERDDCRCSVCRKIFRPMLAAIVYNYHIIMNYYSVIIFGAWQLRECIDSLSMLMLSRLERASTL